MNQHWFLIELTINCHNHKLLTKFKIKLSFKEESLKWSTWLTWFPLKIEMLIVRVNHCPFFLITENPNHCMDWIAFNDEFNYLRTSFSICRNHAKPHRSCCLPECPPYSLGDRPWVAHFRLFNWTRWFHQLSPLLECLWSTE